MPTAPKPKPVKPAPKPKKVGKKTMPAIKPPKLTSKWSKG